MKRFFAILIACSHLGAATSAWASYRVYQLKLEYFDATGKKERERVENSTLDAIQYEQLTGGFGVVKATMLDTWYCPGDTGRKKICDKPKVAGEPTRGPASTQQKRGGLPYNYQPVIP